MCRLNECPGRGSNPHVAEATEGFKPDQVVSRRAVECRRIASDQGLFGSVVQTVTLPSGESGGVPLANPLADVRAGEVVRSWHHLGNWCLLATIEDR